MATTRITTALPPNIDITKAELAYGEHMLPKLVRLFTSLNDDKFMTVQTDMDKTGKMAQKIDKMDKKDKIQL